MAPFLSLPSDLARLVSLLYLPVLLPDPQDDQKYIALTNAATVQWLLNEPVTAKRMGKKVPAIVLDHGEWNDDQLLAVADYLGPLVLGELTSRDRRVGHRTLRRVGLSIPSEAPLAELMRRGCAPPKPKRGR
jgi:hypothetical protein